MIIKDCGDAKISGAANKDHISASFTIKARKSLSKLDRNIR